MVNTNLEGHSGCNILLMEDEKYHSAYVRKISADFDYNERLKKQCIKQQNFKNSKIKVPTIFKQGYTDEGLFYFDMEYIQGITLAKYLKTIEVSKISSLVAELVNIVDRDTSQNRNAREYFIDKISSVESLTYNIESEPFKKSLELLKNYDWNRFDESTCHGDLTLENIIVKNNELYLIDFLDSFYNSWKLDIAKLMQDVQTMWSYRNEEIVNNNTALRLIIFRDILLEKLVHEDQGLYNDIYYALLLHLIRIYPYTKDNNILIFLDRKVTSVIKIIETGCTK